MTLKSADEWPQNFSTIDSTSNPQTIQGRQSIDARETLPFKQTNYLILVKSKGNVAIRAWQVVGTTVIASRAASNLYVKISETLFKRYGTYVGALYEPRIIGRKYGQDFIELELELRGILAREGYRDQQLEDVINNLLIRNPSFFRTGTPEELTELLISGTLSTTPPDDATKTSSDNTVPEPASTTKPGNRKYNKINGPAEQPTLPAPIIKIITRMPQGYAGRGAAASVRPQMVQRYTKPAEADAPAVNLDDVFTFRYIPQGIKYSGLAAEWTEIPRAEDVPFIDWTRWQLMKVSFSFIIANDRTETGGRIVPDGLESSVDSQIEQLRRMAQRKTSVMLFNFDDMLSFQLRRGAANRTSPNMEFVINDLSVTATRRTTDASDGTPSTPSQIAVAQVEITLTEIPVEVVGIVALPPIDSPYLPPSPPTRSKVPDELAYGLFIDEFNYSVTQVSTTYGTGP